ncbi:hypothetical protein DdX_18734 [Ditylenchus destructor]|uniref:VWFA domain-containing protein n=1 Tax=Ditylenchus destructor TaxID=166010 RepID=A0AAD4MJ41_9BILA|nr:hypothetical protein DdX_18734 [Ditylenchus destructor]
MPRKTAKRKAVPAAASAAKKQVKNAGKAANAPEPVIPQNNVAIAAPVLNLTQRKAEVVFSFDTTFSMFPCLTQVRRKINECCERLFREIGKEHLRIGLTAHGDYDTAYLTKHLPMTTNIELITDFVNSVGTNPGYTSPEAYETVLHEAQQFAWLDGWTHVLVMIGDEVPHEKNDNPRSLDWREELQKLKNMGVVVHGVQALNRRHAGEFYAECARVTGGVHMPLDQFNSVVDLVMAVCYREAQPGHLELYEKEIQALPGRYTRSVRTMFDRMLGRPANTTLPPGDMNAVTPGRFQVLDVGDRDVSIKDFVEAQGVRFQKGRGFYEFTKPETVQKYKEIILMEKDTGDMYEGAYARTLLKLPKDADAKISPSNFDYVIFIQSASYNRKLTAGTRFLYEVEDQ